MAGMVMGDGAWGVVVATGWFQGALFGLWMVLLLLLLATGLLLNLFGLAGNWVMLGGMGVHALIADPASRVGVGWGLITVLLLLALAGEAMEFLAGMLGAGKAGGSRRAMALAMAGGIAGAMVGFGLGNAVAPVLGGVFGVILIGAVGSLAGAVLGETWKGKSLEESLETGRGAFVGRITGTLSKTGVGGAMFLLSVGGLVW